MEFRSSRPNSERHVTAIALKFPEQSRSATQIITVYFGSDLFTVHIARTKKAAK